jgi:hypothetical protein
MSQWIASGHVIDLILIIMVLEAAGLLALWRYRQRGIRPAHVFANLAAGASLMLAVRSVLTGGSTETLAVLLALSFVAHLVDLGMRWSK